VRVRIQDRVNYNKMSFEINAKNCVVPNNDNPNRTLVYDGDDVLVIQSAGKKLDHRDVNRIMKAKTHYKSYETMRKRLQRKLEEKASEK